ncbi:MAG: hypothetical protein HY289_12835 [Planctomycetes bacterium]|nr:hypothetical protein [Planctomycetota bacterium]
MPASSLELLDRWRHTSDQQAATELFHRYASRLIGLARAQISPKLARRLSPEDVVQSVCNSFFLRVRDGRLEVQPGDELWSLLATITVHKVFGKVEHHTAKKRSVKREQDMNASDSVCLLDLEGIARDPSPEDEAILADERSRALQSLSPVHRQIVELRLEEYTSTEIAARVGRTDRMVRLVLADFGKRLQERIAELVNS